MLRILARIFGFFAKVDGRRGGLIVPEELFRAIVASFGSGTLVSILIAILGTVVAHAALIFPNPALAGLVTTVLTLILDLLRRQNHGEPATPVAPAKPDTGSLPHA